jgi:hypothetical protein
MYDAERIEGFRKELAELINIYSLESIEDGNVPDFILADVMVNAMLSFNRSHKAARKWHSVELEPGKSRFTDGEDRVVKKCVHCLNDDCTCEDMYGGDMVDGLVECDGTEKTCDGYKEAVDEKSN